MKYIFLLTSLLLVDKNCSSLSPQEVFNTIEYKAISRGFYLDIRIKKNVLWVSKSPTRPPKIIRLSRTSQKHLARLLKPIKISELEHLEPPSKKHTYDGAAITTLKIISNNSTHQTPTFDHGAPPQVLAELVKEILSLARKD